ncbi:hypothetical protein CO731_04469 [Aminobacter sp. MSH1]|uniref:hypothetical protein n=1 Tax=Aminobacter sp. MSH1 TaxID=374606 RepID=UPI000D359102|nr:hypothetical protein [Aminobacter sp. MSH1]AWC24976.1 hypothetical protein CO731_04469 [Aminobacter sp. MSH1]
MTAENVPPKSSRRFSKRMVIANCALAWGAVFASIYFAQAAYVAASAIALIAVLGGAYMGVGHLDLKRLLMTLGSVQGQGGYFPTYSGPPPEGEGE